VARGAVPPAPGPILDEGGAQVGEHDGLHRFTVGQRRGLGNVMAGRPSYVLRLVPEQNAVVVGERRRAARRELEVRDVRWLTGVGDGDLDVLVQVRHRATPLPAHLQCAGTRVRIFVEDALIAAPGQAAVFYRGDTVLGGGWLC
jgi:tRNA-specific 2-thiouridylase